MDAALYKWNKHKNNKRVEIYCKWNTCTISPYAVQLHWFYTKKKLEDQEENCHSSSSLSTRIPLLQTSIYNRNRKDLRNLSDTYA